MERTKIEKSYEVKIDKNWEMNVSKFSDGVATICFNNFKLDKYDYVKDVKTYNTYFGKDEDVIEIKDEVFNKLPKKIQKFYRNNYAKIKYFIRGGSNE
jgi:hypothetical protein